MSLHIHPEMEERFIETERENILYKELEDDNIAIDMVHFKDGSTRYEVCLDIKGDLNIDYIKEK